LLKIRKGAKGGREGYKEGTATKGKKRNRGKSKNRLTGPNGGVKNHGFVGSGKNRTVGKEGNFRRAIT